MQDQVLLSSGCSVLSKLNFKKNQLFLHRGLLNIFQLNALHVPFLPEILLDKYHKGTEVNINEKLKALQMIIVLIFWHLMQPLCMI